MGPDLLLRDASGSVFVDNDWNEAMLNVRTDARRRRIARKMSAWIGDCAAKCCQAVDPDTYDAYTRAPKGLPTPADAKAFLSLLAAHAHEKDTESGMRKACQGWGDKIGIVRRDLNLVPAGSAGHLKSAPMMVDQVRDYAAAAAGARAASRLGGSSPHRHRYHRPRLRLRARAATRLPRPGVRRGRWRTGRRAAAATRSR
ncbi:endo alpha-1,4 polygalactosaminidase [Streptomyces nojiriensis]|uniref:endo alpha-1,4 polygalactosaminidase n=1 Tax=Streptomyces nojiriensis TaxID=66374 RepID=UPI002E16F811